MVFKRFWMVAILCSVQLPVSISINSKILSLYEDYYKKRDNFGEDITFYSLYSVLERHTEYPKIKSCFSEYYPSYGFDQMKAFINNLAQTAHSIKKKETAYPLQRLGEALEHYPTELKSYIYENEYKQAAKLMQETLGMAVFFDIMYTISTDEEKKNDSKFTEEEYLNYLKYREKAKKDMLYLMKFIMTCINQKEIEYEPGAHDIYYYEDDPF